jgi:hypothetical protein
MRRPINTTANSPTSSVGEKLAKNRHLVKKWDVDQKQTKNGPKMAQ